jgi:sulfite exporter TauE/SafE
MTSSSFWITMLVSGLLGSVGHCLGMCGPLNMILGAQIKKSEQPEGISYFLYHLSRVLIYVLLGAAVGLLGSLLGLSKQITTLGGIVSLILGVLILLLGASYLGWLGNFTLERQADWWNTAFSAVLKKRGAFGIVLLGALNGLLPCGLVYSALLLAASTGGVGRAALGMGIFGIGTMPALLALDFGAGALSTRFRQGMLKVVGGLMLIVGLQLVLRGGAALSLWPHLHLGGIALW